MKSMMNATTLEVDYQDADTPDFLVDAGLRVVYELPSTPAVYRENTDAHPLERGLMVDVETTGLDPRTDEIIELCALPFLFDPRSMDVVSVGDPFVTRGQPSFPLSEKIKRITGLSDADLDGEKIDWTTFIDMMDASRLVVAHHAKFDRGMIEAVTGPQRKLWICSVDDVDWDMVSPGASRKLDYLCFIHDFVFDHHRAVSDCRATVHLLAHEDHDTGVGRTYFETALRTALKPRVLVSAVGSAFEKKDLLKARGYSWNVDSKVWEIEIPGDEISHEGNWLETEIYEGVGRHTFKTIDPMRRHAQ